MTLLIDQDRISPYIISSVSSRQVRRIEANINLGVISWSTTKFSKLTSKELEKDVFFLSCHERGTKKKFWVTMRNQTSDLWILHSNALPLSHTDSMVNKVYYEVHMTWVLHTARISNVVCVMFVDRNKRDGKFWAQQRNTERCFFFHLVTSMGQRKSQEFYSRWLGELN